MALALKRKAGEAIKIGDNIVVTIGETRGSYTTVLVDAPREISVTRIEGNNDGHCSSAGKRTGRRRSGKVLHRVPAAGGRGCAVAGTEIGASGGGDSPTADAAPCRGCGSIADCQSDRCGDLR